MKRTILLFLAISTIVIAQSKKTDVPHCGIGGEVCHCLRRTDAIRQKAQAYCEEQVFKSNITDPKKADDALNKCLRGEYDELLNELPGSPSVHCAIAERWTKYDEQDGTFTDEGYSGSKMGPMCTRACKPHQCGCDDGPKCDFK